MARVVAICLIISNIVVGTAGYFLLREMNQRYAELLQSSLPALNTVRALSWETSRIQRAVNRLADSQGTARTELLQRQLAAKNDANALLAQVLASRDGMVSEETKERLQIAHGSYLSTVREWRALVDQQRGAEAAELVVSRVRPAYDQYENLLDEIADSIHDKGLSGTTQLSAEADKLGGGLVLVAAWPLWLGGLAVLFVGLSIVALGIILKWKAPDAFRS
jgi:hypothetical protein